MGRGNWEYGKGDSGVGNGGYGAVLKCTHRTAGQTSVSVLGSRSGKGEVEW